MELKILCKRIDPTLLDGKFTTGEDSADIIGITLARKYGIHDLSEFSFRITASNGGENAAIQFLEMDSFNEDYVHLLWTVTSSFTALTGKITLTLTGFNPDKSVTVKFKSRQFTINSDETLEFLSPPEIAEKILEQMQIELKSNRDLIDKKFSEYKIEVATNEKTGVIKSGNDISVGNDGTVTVNSVKGKTLGKSVPENAVFTDTLYTLPKATTDTLGGIKADGNTITVSNDGTISAKEVQNLTVQVAHPNNFLIYDNAGKPSVMVAIPKFYLDEVIDGASHTVHPAFIINGVEQDVIYISKYKNIVEEGRAYSLPMKKPQTNVNFDTAYEYCKSKGAGWHLMTNAEWAAIALWCKKNGTIPKGNNYYGRDFSEKNLPQKSIPCSYFNNNVSNVLTGSGPENWYHDGTFAGIADLSGNLWELLSGLRLQNGEIQILANNDAADCNNSISEDSPLWKAILSNGTLVDIGESGTLKYSSSMTAVQFSNITVSPDATGNGKVLLEALGLIPHVNSLSSDYNGNAVWINITDERFPKRGSDWTQGELGGLFALNWVQPHSVGNIYYGFRCAYYKV